MRLPTGGARRSRDPHDQRGERSGAARRKSWALLGAVAAVFACGEYDGDEDSTLVVFVQVEPAIERTTAFPAQVLVGFDSSGSGFVVFRVGFLCDPPSAPFVTTAKFEDAAAGASVVDAWLVPLDPGAVASCGALPVPQQMPSSAPPRNARARGSGNVAVFATCGSDETRSAIVVLGG